MDNGNCVYNEDLKEDRVLNAKELRVILGQTES
ncbi:MAG: hypothetical protein ACI9RU_001200, partial [Litorivivens sp.]